MRLAKSIRTRALVPVRGFTLVELLIVVLVIGILAAVSVPRYAASVDRYRVEGAARRIQHDLRYAQARAVSTSQSVTVTFSVGANEYELNGQQDLRRPAQPYRIQLALCETPAVLTDVNIDGAAIVTFDLHGQPYAGSNTATPLISAAVTVTAGGQSRVISIQKATGTVSIQ